MQVLSGKNAASERQALGSGTADAPPASRAALTATETRMLVRLERAGWIYWRAIKAQETRTLRRLVAKGFAVEGAGDRGLLGWRLAGPNNDPRAEAREFARGALAELSTEVLGWRRSGMLSGDRLREMAGMLKGLSPSDDALQQAERMVETLALELAASGVCQDGRSNG